MDGWWMTGDTNLSQPCLHLQSSSTPACWAVTADSYGPALHPLLLYLSVHQQETPPPPMRGWSCSWFLPVEGEVNGV